jgi:integrase
MRKCNAENERTKRRYLGFLTEAKQLAPDTVDQVAAALADFEAATGSKDFRLFRTEWAESYKRRLSAATNNTTGRPLSKSTISARLAALKAFFQWLSQESGFKSRIKYTDAEYFNPSAKDARIARGQREKQVPSIEQIRHAVALMPVGTDIERRDRALIAFAILSGARDDAIASMSLKHVDLERRRISQNAREGVRTKNAKTITSTFFPVGSDIEAIVAEWLTYLAVDRLWGPDDPLFPAPKVELGESGHFENAGLDRRHWKDAAAIRRIFREAFTRAGLPYFNPHTFRHTLASLGERICPTPEAFKAWSQNLGHAHVLTTFTSYGAVAQNRQDEIMAELASGSLSARSQPSSLIVVESERLERMEQMIARLGGSPSRV